MRNELVVQLIRWSGKRDIKGNLRNGLERSGWKRSLSDSCGTSSTIARLVPFAERKIRLTIPFALAGRPDFAAVCENRSDPSGRFQLKDVRGKLPRTAGWQPAFPRTQRPYAARSSTLSSAAMISQPTSSFCRLSQWRSCSSRRRRSQKSDVEILVSVDSRSVAGMSMPTS